VSTPRHTASQHNGHSSHSHQYAHPAHHQSQQRQQQRQPAAARYSSAPNTPLFTADANTSATAAAAAAQNTSRASVAAAELSRSGSLSPSRVYGLGPRGRQQQPRQQQQQQFGSYADVSSSAQLKRSEHFQLNTSGNSGVAARSPAVSQW
jgi:hypothetical protein